MRHVLSKKSVEALFAATGLIWGGTGPQAAMAQSTSCSAYNQNFKVYFESGSAVPTPQGLAVIDQALSNVRSARGCAIGQITLPGHQDTAGLTRFNEALSYAMAYAIAEEFMERGVPGDKIIGEGKGETEPAKATADGVREPLNRRVDVSIVLTKA